MTPLNLKVFSYFPPLASSIFLIPTLRRCLLGDFSPFLGSHGTALPAHSLSGEVYAVVAIEPFFAGGDFHHLHGVGNNVGRALLSFGPLSIGFTHETAYQIAQLGLGAGINIRQKIR